MKKEIKGQVWSGFIGEYKRPPIYIIITPGINGKTVFIDDILREFITQKVKIIIESEIS